MVVQRVTGEAREVATQAICFCYPQAIEAGGLLGSLVLFCLLSSEAWLIGSGSVCWGTESGSGLLLVAASSLLKLLATQSPVSFVSCLSKEGPDELGTICRQSQQPSRWEIHTTQRTRPFFAFSKETTSEVGLLVLLLS